MVVALIYSVAVTSFAGSAAVAAPYGYVHVMLTVASPAAKPVSGKENVPSAFSLISSLLHSMTSYRCRRNKPKCS